MRKNVYRYFGGFIAAQEKWLNKMAAAGYRLIKTGRLLYQFEPCESGKYQYKVEFIADQSKKSAEGYKAFLEGCGYTVLYKNANLNYSIGKVRYRPWASEGGKIATNSTTFNRELLIVEKENDGKKFVLHTTVTDQIEYYKKWRNIWLTYTAIWTVLSLMFAFKNPLVSIVLDVIVILTLIPAIAYQEQMQRLRRQSDVEE